MELKLKWNKSSETKYDIYRSDRPGENYAFLDTIDVSGNEVEVFEFERLLPIENLNGAGTNHTVTLTWDEVYGGSPDTYKIVPYNNDPDPQPLFSPSPDSAWMNATLPIGASWIDSTGSLWSVTRYFTENSSLVVEATDDYSYPQFGNATFPINQKYIVVWVYIDPDNVPDSIMIGFFDGGWDHRVYWGEDLFPFGIEGTPSMYHMGSIPSTGSWVPLVIDREIINAGDITGMGFGVYKKPAEGEGPQTGRVYFDSIYYSSQRIYTPEQQYTALDKFNVYRQGPNETGFHRIGDSTTSEFIDDDAPDIHGYGAENYRPNYSLASTDTGQEIVIKWSVPSGVGTEYSYRVETLDKSGETYDYSEVSASVVSEHDSIVIKGGVNPDYDLLPTIATETDNEFTHSNLEPGTLYYYRLESYNGDGEMTSRLDTKMRTKVGSRLDFFILGDSILA